MTKISDFMNTDFDVVDAAWSTKRALDFASAVDVGYIIVKKAMGGRRSPLFYLLALEEFQRRLEESRSARVSSMLAALAPTPTLLQKAALHAATRAIVLRSGQPVGVVEPDAVEAAMVEGMALEARPRAADAGTEDSDGGGGGGDGGGPPVPRTLVGEMPAAVKVGTPATLSVTLTARTVSGKGAGSFAVPAGTRIDIIVRAEAPLVIEGDENAHFIVSEPQVDDIRTFGVKATGTGTGRVRVHATHGGMPLVVLEVTTEAMDALPASVAPPTPQRTEIDMAPRRNLELSLYIFEREDEITFFLQSADKQFNMTRYPPVKLNTPRVYFQDFFRDIERLPAEQASEGLRTQGLKLFRTAVPKELRKALWSLKDKVRTLQINSDEPWIPWEVCKLEGLVDGRVVEGPFFAEAFNVTRWFAGIASVPKIKLGNIALVVPGDSRLTSAPQEKVYVESLRSASRQVANIAARKSAVTDAMQRATYDAWHFTGHAQAPVTADANEAPIELENSEKLTPNDIVGATSNLLQTKPFIFFNACQSARGGMSLTGAGGWAQRFIKDTDELPSAAAFVGTYWQVDDDKALAFAKAFYQGLFKPMPIGEAAHAARLAAQSGAGEPYDTSWLAYTVYADPSATVA